jgi:formylglycine-generating enzyme required for sulfatase activity
MDFLPTQMLDTSLLNGADWPDSPDVPAGVDMPPESVVLTHLAETHYAQRNWREAAAFFQAALQSFAEAGDDRSRASMMSILGETYRHLHEYETAMELLRESAAIHNRLDDRRAAALALVSIGNVFDDTGRKSDALETYRLAEQIFLDQGDCRSAAVMLSRQSELLHERFRRDDAVEAATAAAGALMPLDEAAAEHLRQRIARWRDEAGTPAVERAGAPADRQSSRELPCSMFNFETLTLDKRGRIVRRITCTGRQFRESLEPGLALEMVALPGGVFTMGAPAGEESSLDTERPQHQVTVSPFYIGKFAVTQAQWRAVADWPMVQRSLEADPAHFKGDDRPVECVSWLDAVEFCARLTRMTGHTWRLPTEAEWEYACRAGTATPFAFGETITHGIVNYYSEYPYAKAARRTPRCKTVLAGSLGAANAFGLYDMHGNTREWCQDWYGPYTDEPRTDPTGPATGTGRVLRGGAWHVNAYSCRSAERLAHPPHLKSDAIGFRVVLTA